jgi:hypothetical protein
MSFERGDVLSTIDKRYYEASELDLEEIRVLAKRIAERTKKEPHDGRWRLASRRFDKDENDGGYLEEDRSIISYYLRGDGVLATNYVSHTESPYRQEVNEGTEQVLQEKDILLFDFKPEYWHSDKGGTKISTDRDPSDEVIVPWKGFGMKALLYGLLAEPVKIRERANEGDAYSQWRLGFCYFFGAGIQHDFTEAVKWFQKATKQGSAEAQFALGRCYQYGCGLTQDLERAKQWYGDAAKQGHEKAQAKLDQNLRW